MASATLPDDIELGEREDDAFLPSSPSTSSSSSSSSSSTNKPRIQSNFLTRYVPHRILDFYTNLTKLKLMILLLLSFILLLTWVTLANKVTTISIPSESIELSEKVAKQFASSPIPDYVLKYAPLVYLDKQETYFPSDLAKHIKKTHPTQNFTTVPLANPNEKLTLDNLSSQLPNAENVFLTSTKNVIDLPKFLKGKKPDPKTLQTHHAKTCAVIVVEKEGGIVDAFYMYFYSFNAGPHALGHVAGNHAGDWEHNTIRFLNGQPQSIWYSQHEYGQAFSFSSVTQAGIRPIVYSARGSHANYASAGGHDLHAQVAEIPRHIVWDNTSRGTPWDPTLSAYFYTYETKSKEFKAVGEETPVDWLKFEGKWGDQEYSMEKKGQESFHGFKKWTGGPQGPWFKALDRKEVCWPNEKKKCTILDKV